MRFKFILKIVSGSGIFYSWYDLTFVPSSPASSFTGSQLSAEPSTSAPPRGRWPQFVLVRGAQCGGDPGGFRVSSQFFCAWGWEASPQQRSHSQWNRTDCAAWCRSESKSWHPAARRWWSPLPSASLLLCRASKRHDVNILFTCCSYNSVHQTASAPE